MWPFTPRKAAWDLTPDKPEVGAKGVSWTPESFDVHRSFYGASWGSYGAMYRRQPAVRAAVDFISKNIAQLNPKVYERVGNTDRIEVGDHPLAVLLRNPNPAATRFSHLRDTVADLAIYDRAYWVKIRQGGRLNVVRQAPSTVHREMRDGRAVWFGPNGQEWRSNQLVVFHGYHPDGDEEGVSPLETLRRVLAEEAAALQHRENMWNNAARQSGWIKRPLEAPPWSDDARARFRTDVEAVMTGRGNAGRIGVLEEGMDWDPSSFSPHEMDYIAGRRLTYEEVAIAYGLDPSLMGVRDEANANIEARHRQLYQDVLGPWLRMLQDEIQLQLLPDVEPFNRNQTVYVEFNLAEKLKGSFEEQQRALTTAIGVPHLTINEGRSRLNLPRIDAEWADVPVQPMNVIYGGQPAVTVPTEVPEPGTRSSRPRTKATAPAAALRRRDDAAKKHEALLRRHFERQEDAVVSAMGAKAAVPGRERWNRELRADLFLLATQVARRSGRLAARQLDGVYDEQRTLSWLEENARIAAETINAQTFDAIGDADDLDAVRHEFDVAKNSRAEALGVGRATTVIAFARAEAAKHSSENDGRTRHKVWIVTSAKSRHPELDGETVPVGAVFSNGAQYPGDAAALGSAGTAGCKCLLQLQ